MHARPHKGRTKRGSSSCKSLEERGHSGNQHLLSTYCVPSVHCPNDGWGVSDGSCPACGPWHPLYPLPQEAPLPPPCSHPEPPCLQHTHQTLVPLQVCRAPQGALAKRELWASPERGDLQGPQALLAPLGPQPLLDHPTPGSPSMVSRLGSQQVQLAVG